MDLAIYSFICALGYLTLMLAAITFIILSPLYLIFMILWCIFDKILHFQ